MTRRLRRSAQRSRRAMKTLSAPSSRRMELARKPQANCPRSVWQSRKSLFPVLESPFRRTVRLIGACVDAKLWFAPDGYSEAAHKKAKFQVISHLTGQNRAPINRAHAAP